MEPSKTNVDPPSETILGQNAMGVPPGSVVQVSGDDRVPVLPAPEQTRVTVWCPECQEAVLIHDAHAFVLGIHQRVCSELERVNGVDA